MLVRLLEAELVTRPRLCAAGDQKQRDDVVRVRHPKAYLRLSARSRNYRQGLAENVVKLLR